MLSRMNAETEAISAHRGVVRYLVLVLDLSENMVCADVKPDRCSLMFSLIEEFISEYFDQNPMSHLAIVSMKDGLAYQISRLCCR